MERGDAGAIGFAGLGFVGAGAEPVRALVGAILGFRALGLRTTALAGRAFRTRLDWGCCFTRNCLRARFPALVAVIALGFLLRGFREDFMAARLARWALAAFELIFLNLRAASSACSVANRTAALASLAALRAVLKRALALRDRCFAAAASLTASLSCCSAAAACCFAFFRAASSFRGFMLEWFLALTLPACIMRGKERDLLGAIISVGQRRPKKEKAL